MFLRVTLWLVCLAVAGHAVPYPVFVRTARNVVQDVGLGGTEFTTTFILALAYQVNVSAGPANTRVETGSLAGSRLIPEVKPINTETFSVLADVSLWASGRPAFAPASDPRIEPGLPWVIQELFYRVTVAINLDLQDFPYDAHWFSTTIQLQIPPASVAELVPTETAVPIVSVDPAWDLKETYVRALNVTSDILEQDFSEIGMFMKLRRKSGYYRNKILSVMCALVVMGWLLFFLDMRDGRRVQCISVLFLSLVAFNQSAQSSLPRVSYLTRLDVFTIFAIANQFLVFALMNFHVLGETMIVRYEQRLVRDRDQRERERAMAAAKKAASSKREPTVVLDPSWTSVGPYARQQREGDKDDDGPVDIIEVDGSELPRWMAVWAMNRFYINYGSMALAVFFFTVTAPIVVYLV